jgi:hypothetical protein
MEPDKEYTEGAAQLKATNLAFLGIVPDVTHEWIATVTTEIGVSRGMKRSKVWQQCLTLWRQRQGKTYKMRGGGYRLP